jgi:hypothetical protein
VYFDYKLGSSPFFDRTIRFGNVFTGVSSIGVSTTSPAWLAGTRIPIACAARTPRARR